MHTSEQINELAGALAKAQAEMLDAHKDGFNQHLGQGYATLHAVMAAIRQPLAKHGLALVQGVENHGGEVTVTTRLLHATGQWLQTRLAMPVPKQSPHGVGTAATYCRRYAAAAIVGLAQSDDDAGEAGEQPGRLAEQDGIDLERALAGVAGAEDTNRLNEIANWCRPRATPAQWQQINDAAIARARALEA